MRELNDRERIEEIIRRAKAERSRALGEFIANQIFAAWTGLKRLGAALAAPATPAAKRPGALGIPDPR
jgi:hypothetical protein